MLTIQKLKVVIVVITIDIVIIVDTVIIVGLVKKDKIICKYHQEDELFHFHPH
jgi:hypothetical protein